MYDTIHTTSKSNITLYIKKSQIDKVKLILSVSFNAFVYTYIMCSMQIVTE